MSFSYDTKNELCRLPVQRLCCARAEAYGILLYCSTFHPGEVRVVTENPNFAARLPRLFHRAFGLRFDRQPEPEQQEGKRVFQLTDGKKLDHIINLLGYDPRQNPVLHINFGMLEEECCRSAFLRGVFFAGGSITDPAKRYHLELTTSHMQVSRELDVLLRECGYPPKSVSRNGSFVTYFKQSQSVLRPGGGLRHFALLQHVPPGRGAGGDGKPQFCCPPAPPVPPGVRTAVRPPAGAGATGGQAGVPADGRKKAGPHHQSPGL